MIPNIVKEREKIIFGGTLGVLIIGALLLGNLSAKRQLAVTERIARVEQGDILSGSDSETEGNSGLAGVLKSVPPISLSEGLELSGRDIFSRELEQPESERGTAGPQLPRFQIIEITPKPLGISYEGRIIFSDGRIVAQVNMGKTSYLVGVGSTLSPYTIADLNNNMLVLLAGTTRYVVSYRQSACSDELMATIKELNTNTTFLVTKNSDFLGGTVLDIDEESVLVSKQGQYLRIEKGTVYP